MTNHIGAMGAVIFLCLACSDSTDSETDSTGGDCVAGAVEPCIMENGAVGIRQCVAATWSPCVPHMCVAGEMGPCTSTCGGEGVRLCGYEGLWDACVVDEQCNGKDDDCDGLTDEGPDGQPLVLGCNCGMTVGVQQCLEGWFAACSAGAAGTAEACNGKDDDCDGDTDEGCDTDKDGYCNAAMELPEGSAAVCPLGPGDCDDHADYVHPAAVEVCNGRDDNCDGILDDVGSETCGLGDCEHESDLCDEGKPAFCDPWLGKQEEVSDGKDNDCDGQTDEGNPVGCAPQGASQQCGKNVGECEVGVQLCGPDGAWGECSGTMPLPELCDGKDNDCDGITDNGNPQGGESCGTSLGECEEGMLACLNGKLKCLGEKPPTEEICDTLDNDCDGDIDEILVPDTFENNDGCGQAKFIGQAIENSDQPLTISAMLYKQTGGTDVDWYKVEADELSDFAPCSWSIPADDDCYEFSVTLDVPEGVNFDLCVHMGDCSGLQGSKCSTTPVKGYDEVVRFQWLGTYGVSDNRFAWVEIKGATANDQTCVQYGLTFEMVGQCPVDGVCWWEQ